MFQSLLDKGFQIVFVSHAKAILSVDFADAVTELDAILASVTIPIQEIVGSGGGESKVTQRLRHALANVGWKKTNFNIEKIINGVRKESESHEVDHVRQYVAGAIALEIEWNNKDPFFDRDLENFKRLHAEGAISVGFIVTRGTRLQDRMFEFVKRFADEAAISSFDDLAKVGLKALTKRQQSGIVDRLKRKAAFGDAWSGMFVSDKYGAATTHWRKLEDRIARGVGNPCPLVMIGLPDTIVTFDGKLIAEVDEDQGD